MAHDGDGGPEDREKEPDKDEPEYGWVSSLFDPSMPESKEEGGGSQSKEERHFRAKEGAQIVCLARDRGSGRVFGHDRDLISSACRPAISRRLIRSQTEPERSTELGDATSRLLGLRAETDGNPVIRAYAGMFAIFSRSQLRCWAMALMNLLDTFFASAFSSARSAKSVFVASAAKSIAEA